MWSPLFVAWLYLLLQLIEAAVGRIASVLFSRRHIVLEANHPSQELLVQGRVSWPEGIRVVVVQHHIPAVIEIDLRSLTAHLFDVW